MLILLFSTALFHAIYLAADIWTAANSFVGDLINQIMGILTGLFILFMIVSLIFMMVSNNDRTVGIAKSWVWRVVICYIIIMSLGALKTYLSNKLTTYNYTVSVVRTVQLSCKPLTLTNGLILNSD